MKQGPAWLLRLDAPPGDGPTVAVKDAIDVAGTVTTVGARSREDSGPAAADAPCVAAVRRSGGRIIGKTNLSELCWFADGVNEHTGTPLNPLDPRRVPGGSSSGSAVAVALGEADVALGTDTGGSVRIPAAACGIAGLKTTRGRISTAGVFPLSPPLDTVGPLARDVAGLVTAMALLEPGFEAAVPARRPVVVRLRVGEDVGVAPDVEHDVDEALAAAGWEVRERRVYGWKRAVSAAARILDAEAGPAQAFLLDRPELLSDRARTAIEACLRERPEDVARARATMTAFDAELGGAAVRCRCAGAADPGRGAAAAGGQRRAAAHGAHDPVQRAGLARAVGAGAGAAGRRRRAAVGAAGRRTGVRGAAARARFAAADPGRRPGRLASQPWRLERGDQATEQGGQRLALLAGQRRQQVTLAGQQVGQRGVDPLLAAGGEADVHAPAVGRVGKPLHETADLQPVDPVGHGAGGHQGLGEQLTGGEDVRTPRATQRRQHVELPHLELVRLERAAPGPVEVPGETGDAAEHLERPDVEVRTLAGPRGDQPVDLVLHRPHLPDAVEDAGVDHPRWVS